MQQGQCNQELLAPQTRVLNLVLLIRKAYSKPGSQEEIKRNAQVSVPPAKQAPKLEYPFAPGLPSRPTYAKLSNWCEKLACLVFQKVRLPSLFAGHTLGAGWQHLPIRWLCLMSLLTLSFENAVSNLTFMFQG